MMTIAPLALALLSAPAPQDSAREAASAPRALEELLEPIRANHGLPALGAAAITADGVVAIGAVGIRSRYTTVEVTRQDRWHLGSCGKAMTATLVARLVERDVVGFDQTLEQLFPEHREAMNDAWRSVTLDMLLRHTGGMQENPMAIWADLQRRSPRDARAHLVEWLLANPPAGTPGKYVYSNTGYCVAAAALERATKKTWSQLMREEVFGPLAMKSAGFGVPGTSVLDEPRGHRFAPDMDPVPVIPGPLADNPEWMGPAGTVHANLGDWGRFVQVHLAGARGVASDYLSAESFQRLHRPSAGADYACGWKVSKRDGKRALWHKGSNTTWFSVMYVLPDEGRAIVVACNQATGGEEACDAAFDAVRAQLDE